ncbi:hypothetical protein EB232_10815 [Mesorhizobium sp. NZP2077]|nr:hypothetical protein EB232_10815 [Mesorhizobium sp. NZP2077]
MQGLNQTSVEYGSRRSATTLHGRRKFLTKRAMKEGCFQITTTKFLTQTRAEVAPLGAVAMR